MKKGFILISTLSLVTILSFLTILISKQIFNDSVSTNIYQESIKKRIELINYEKFITENLLNNSNLLRNLNIAEKEFNFIAKRSFSNLTIELEDMNSCFNLNALVKSKNGITEKNDENVLNFLVFLSKSFVNKNSHIEFLHRIVDSIDTNSFPETYGAEDLYYISNERLNLASDQNFYHKSQIKDLNLNFLTDADFQKIYGNICALPSNEIKLNINNINFNNQKVFHSIFSDLTVKDIEKIILNKPETGYLNYKDLVDRTSINQIKLKNKYIVFKPIFIKIKYTLQIEEYMFKLISFIDLSNRENNIIYRTISDENIYF